MHIAKKIAQILVLVGALNWGIVGVTTGGFNLVAFILGSGTTLENIVYVLVGISAVVLVLFRNKGCSCANGVCECDVKVTKTEEGTKVESEGSVNA